MRNEEEETSFEISCNLIEKELKTTLRDVAKIRNAKSSNEIRRISHMLKAALRNVRYHLKDIERNLKE